MKKIKFSRQKVEPNNPWEANFGKILTPFEEFVHGEINSGILLIVFTVIALFLANSGFSESYMHFFHTYFSVGTDAHQLKMSVHHWINDGLMTFFFFLVGLEIKREILVGELSILRKAMLPVCAAIGGMVVPALFYHMLNQGGAGEAGWGIPMATDIAFAVTALVLLGSRIPKSLVMFLVALAIVDDMGAVLVIAIFYTTDLNMYALFYALLTFLVLMFFNQVGIRKSWVYGVAGFVLWIFMYKSGIHATIAGILTAIAVPARPKYNPEMFSNNARRLLDKFDTQIQKENDVLRNVHLNGILQTLKRGTRRAQTPLQSLESKHHIPVNFLIIPIFALANAGIPVQLSTLSQVLADPVTMGVILGLVLGKPVGIFLACLIAVKLKLCELPDKVGYKHVLGAGFLAGIGFTMSIFISELAFPGSDEHLVLAKTGILFASIIAAVIGYLVLYLCGAKKSQSVQV